MGAQGPRQRGQEEPPHSWAEIARRPRNSRPLLGRAASVLGGHARSRTSVRALHRHAASAPAVEAATLQLRAPSRARLTRGCGRPPRGAALEGEHDLADGVGVHGRPPSRRRAGSQAGPPTRIGHAPGRRHAPARRRYFRIHSIAPARPTPVRRANTTRLPHPSRLGWSSRLVRRSRWPRAWSTAAAPGPLPHPAPPRAMPTSRPGRTVREPTRRSLDVRTGRLVRLTIVGMFV